MSHVIVKLIGGLGNQMFQYAAARAVAHQHGASLRLDVSGFETYGLRRYELHAYPLAATLATPDDLAEVEAKPVGRSWLTRLLSGARPPAFQRFNERSFTFDPSLASQRLPLYMEGYWQSERYFAGVAPLLREELTPSEPLDPMNKEVAATIDSTQSVSIHVRRGDYVSNAHTNSYHGICSLDYYSRAIDKIAEMVDSPHLFVFSDDPDWTRENLRSHLPTTYVVNPADSAFRDLQLMSRCRHHILANSSFSWWGAWLNPRQDKIVIAPAQWFRTSQNDTRDLIPDTWIQL